MHITNQPFEGSVEWSFLWILNIWFGTIQSLQNKCRVYRKLCSETQHII